MKRLPNVASLPKDLLMSNSEREKAFEIVGKDLSRKDKH